MLFWTEIIMKNQDCVLENIYPGILSKVNNLLKKNSTYMWYQDGISLDAHRMDLSFQFRTTGRKKLKYPNVIDNKVWKELDR